MTQSDTTVTFTRDELIAEIDRVARRSLGISAADFAQAYKQQRLDRRTIAADLIFLLNMLREDDPIFERR